ncbi:MAG: acetyl-CoA carboxylase, carboxyltransferase subunit beta, partial [Endomicrobiales bacterium]
MPKHTASSTATKKEIPHGLWTKCKKCDHIIYEKTLKENCRICPKCGYYFRLTPAERIEQLTDRHSFKEHDAGIKPKDILGFPDYARKIAAAKTAEAVVTGEAKIGGHPVVVAVMNFEYMGGSMGSVVGEKIVRAIEKAIEKKCPVIIVSASGGARMQEGILSLMQMGKTSAALSQLAKKGLAYISILTDPTTGGVAASFSMLGDINITEPKALIGFAGPRVIEQTIRQQLPEGFQLSEFLEQHGMVDIIVERKDMKSMLTKILAFLN